MLGAGPLRSVGRWWHQHQHQCTLVHSHRCRLGPNERCSLCWKLPHMRHPRQRRPEMLGPRCRRTVGRWWELHPHQCTLVHSHRCRCGPNERCSRCWKPTHMRHPRQRRCEMQGSDGKGQLGDGGPTPTPVRPHHSHRPRNGPNGGFGVGRVATPVSFWTTAMRNAGDGMPTDSWATAGATPIKPHL